MTTNLTPRATALGLAAAFTFAILGSIQWLATPTASDIALARADGATQVVVIQGHRARS